MHRFTLKFIDLRPIQAKYFHDDLSLQDVYLFSKMVARSNLKPSAKSAVLNELLYFLTRDPELRELMFWPYYFLIQVFQETDNVGSVCGVLDRAQRTFSDFGFESEYLKISIKGSFAFEMMRQYMMAGLEYLDALNLAIEFKDMDKAEILALRASRIQKKMGNIYFARTSIQKLFLPLFRKYNLAKRTEKRIMMHIRKFPVERFDLDDVTKFEPLSKNVEFLVKRDQNKKYRIYGDLKDWLSDKWMIIKNYLITLQY